jgi:Arm DNA-binding domain
MRKMLTVAAIEKLKPGPVHREIADAGAPGLALCIQPSGARSWIVRYRRPEGRPAKLTLGTVDVMGKGTTAAPVVGGHLTLGDARVLATQVALGQDPAADKQAKRAATKAFATDTFAAAAVAFVKLEARPNTRSWQATARLLGLQPNGDELELIPNGIAKRWATRPVRSIRRHEIADVLDECKL